MKECKCGRSVEPGKWFKMFNYDGCCDICGNPQKFNELICRYVGDVMRNGTKLHIYWLKQGIPCLSCGIISPGVNIYCGELDSGLRVKEAVEVVREKEQKDENN